MAKGKKVIVVPLEKFKELQHDLRQYNVNWMDDLLKHISEDKTLEKKVREQSTQRKIYNVLNGVIRNGQWKLFVLKQLHALLDDYKSKWEAVKK